MAELLTPEEAKKELKVLQARIKKLQSLSYDSKKRGYEFEGKVLGKLDIAAAIEAMGVTEKTLLSNLSQSLKERSVANKKSLALGVEYQKLVDIAEAIKVKNYESSIEKLKAWGEAKRFVENNKDIIVATEKLKERGGFPLGGGGGSYVPDTAPVNTKTASEQFDLAKNTAVSYSEKDTTTNKRIKVGRNMSKTQVDITDEPTLIARQLEIDLITAGENVPLDVATPARKGVAPVSTTSPTLATPKPKPSGGSQNKGTSATSARSARAAATIVKPVVSVTPPVTNTGTGPGKGEVLFDGKKVKVGGSKWQQIIQDEFGSLWDVYNDNSDVHKVIDQSVKEGWYNDETKLTARLQNTNWFRTTQSATRQYNIKKSTDPATLESNINTGIEDTRALSLKAGSGIVLTDSTLRMLTENKLKFGWSDQQLLNAIGSEAVATAQGGAQGIASLRQGSVAAGLRTSADNYAQKVDPAMLDMWTEEILKGTKTETQFTEQMKLQASQQYRSLAPQIEKDQTVKEAVTMYSNAAQNVLGIDPSTIDWTQDKWGKALNYKDPKTNEYRTMDSSEWNRHLRAQPEWKKTDDAKNIYRNLALTLASGFGKTL